MLGTSAYLSEVMKFAAAAHVGQCRKGSTLPYLVHPVEAALIAMTLTDDEELIAAVLLHDVIEDTDVTAEELKERFGGRVAALVECESEDKMRHLPPQASWKARKTAALSRLGSADRETRLICLCDKLSNIRQCAEDKKLSGDEMWNKFNNSSKDDQEWYYRSIAERLSCFGGTAAYEEYLALLDEVFDQ